MQLSEEIRRIQQIIGIKLINEQTQTCPTLDEILKGEIDNVDISKYEYFKSGVIKDIAKSGWGPGTSEDESIKLLKDNIKNLDDLISFSNAWKGYISDNTKSTGWFGWENDLFNWVFNYETFAAYIKEEDDGNDIMSEMEPIWNGWISEFCNKTYENIELEQDKYYIEYFNLNVTQVKKYSKGQLVKTYDLNTIQSDIGKDHGRFVWEIGFKIKPTQKYSMQSIKIIDNYTKTVLFNCGEPLCQLPVELGKEFSNNFTYTQLGDFTKPWINCEIEFNNGETKEFTYGEITYTPVVSTITTKEINTKGNLVQNGRHIQITQGTDKIKSIQVYSLDGKVVSTSTDLDFFLPNKVGTYFIVINYADKKKKQSLVKVLYTAKKTSIASQEIN
jgi:hypothetical protein